MGPIQRRVVKGVLAVVAWPKVTLAIAAVVLVGCVGLALTNLRISTDQNKLFSEDVKFFRDYVAFEKKFPENGGLYVLLEARDPAHPPAPARWMELADRIADRLRKMPDYVETVDVRTDPKALGKQGILFDDPAQARKNFEEFRQFAGVIVGQNAQPKGGLGGLLPVPNVLSAGTPLTRTFAALGAGSPPETADPLRVLANSITETLRKPDVPAQQLVPDLSKLGGEDPRSQGYAYLPDESDPTGKRHVLLITIDYVERYNNLTAISDIVDAIRNAARDVGKSYPDFIVGVTGRPALEADEMRTTDHDTKWAEIAATCTIFVGLVLMFMPWGDLRTARTRREWLRAVLTAFYLALVAEVALGVGIGWTFGWATIAIGELNLLSLVFVIALIGIGMDYLIQILARYRREVRRYERQSAVWTRVFRYVSPPISTACLGAAGAFLVSRLTDFRGAGELGVIAGGGLLLCLLAGYTVLPAILVLLPARLKMRDPSERYSDHKNPPPAGWWKLITPTLWVVLLLIGIQFMLKTYFNPNLLDLQAQGLQSVQLVRKLQTWQSVVLSKDLGLLRKIRDEVRKSPLVATTESVADAWAVYEFLHQHQNELPRIDPDAATPVKPDNVAGFERGVAKLAGEFDAYLRGGKVFDAADRAKVASAAESLRRLQAELSAADTPAKRDALAARLTQWQHGFLVALRTLEEQQFMPPEPNLDALPKEVRLLKDHLRAADGTYALYIIPKEQLWGRGALKAFVTDVESRAASVPGAPDVTGIASNIYHSTSSIERAFYLATAYAMGLIVVLVWLDLRNVGQTLLAISVLVLGLPMLVAIMGLLGVSWNFANFFGLPILIGAGHEYGVFMVHRYREVLHNPRRVWRMWDVSDRGLLMCAFVTCASFFYLWFGRHKGISSLGLVMWVGVGCIYLATILVVRPVLTWRLQHKGVYGERSKEQEAGSKKS